MNYMRNGDNFNSKIISQVLQSVECLHENNIVHRDIKPENIVLFFIVIYNFI
jgi:serine/threonine protein kinase